jgi:hypothetical protein
MCHHVQVVSYAAQSVAERTALVAGTYNAAHAVYPGATVGATIWNATDSRSAFPDASFTVRQARRSPSLLAKLHSGMRARRWHAASMHAEAVPTMQDLHVHKAAPGCAWLTD